MKLISGGYLTFYMPQRNSRVNIPLEHPTLLKDVLAGLGIPAVEVHLAAVNGAVVELETALVQDSDEVRILSAVDGG